MRDTGPLELEDTPGPRAIRPLPGATMFVPPRVRVVAVEDQHRREPACDGETLLAFYRDLLGFHAESSTVFRAERHRVVFDLPTGHEPAEPFPPVGIRVPVELRRLERTLAEDWRLEVERVTTLWPGSDALLLDDPGGCLIALGEHRELL